METPAAKKRISPFAVLLLSFLAFIILALLTRATIYPAIFLAWPVALVFKYAKGWMGIIFTALSIAACRFMIGGSLWYFAPIFYMPMAIGILIGLNKKMRSFFAVGAGVLGGLCGLGLVLGAFWLIKGVSILDYTLTSINELVRTDDGASIFAFLFIKASAYASGSPFISQEEITELITITPEAARAFLLAEDKLINTLKEPISLYLPPLMARAAGLGGGFGYIVVRALLKRGDAEVAPIPSFDDFYIPKGYSAYFVITYFLTYIPVFFELPKLYIASQILYSLITAGFLIQGISFIYYLFHKRIKKKGGAGALAVLIGVLLSPIVVWLGLFDQLFRPRERARLRKQSR